MARTAAAGAAYFGLVFLLGMILGPLRMLVLEPRVGSVAAVLIELPVMLAAAWLVCGWLVARFAIPAAAGPRLAMGGLAFLLLMAAELGLSLFAVGGTAAEHFQSYREAAPFIGLLGQIAFAAFPLLRRRGVPGAAPAR